jgi:hypothetical protein
VAASLKLYSWQLKLVARSPEQRTTLCSGITHTPLSSHVLGQTHMAPF